MQYFSGPGHHLPLTLERMREVFEKKMRLNAAVTHIHALAWWKHATSTYRTELAESESPDNQAACLQYPHGEIQAIIASVPAAVQTAAAPQAVAAPTRARGAPPVKLAQRGAAVAAGAAVAPRVAQAAPAAVRYVVPNNYPDAC